MSRSTLSPTVTPGRRGHCTLKFRTNLPVVFHRHFRRSTTPTTKIRRKEGEHKFREAQAGFHPVFQVVAVGISFQSCNRFVCPTQLNGKGFRTFKQVPVRISYGSRSTQVARRVGTFNFKRKRLVLVAGKHDIRIQISRISLQLFTETDVGIFQDVQSPQGRIGVLHIAVTIQFSGLQIIIITDYLRTQEQLILIEKIHSTRVKRIHSFQALGSQLCKVHIEHKINIANIILTML